ncbi:hypothetical protein ACWCPI_38740 [Streptomyces sp. NPDC001920]
MNGLILSGTTILNSEGPALVADGATVQGDAHFDGKFHAEGSSRRGTVRLPGATINGQMSLTHAKILNDSGPALIADRLKVQLGADFGGFRANGAGSRGAVRLAGAKLNGQLSLRGAIVLNDNGPALEAMGVGVRGGAFFDQEFMASGSDKDGAVNLAGAAIDGLLSLTGAKIENSKGPALVADRIAVQEGAFLDQGFEAQGASSLGSVRLAGATISGQLNAQAATFSNEDGPALVADNVKVQGGAYFDDSLFEASAPLSLGADAVDPGSGGGHLGAVRLFGAAIDGQLSLKSVMILNDSGPALVADDVVVAGSTFLDEEFSATGAGEVGVVSLSHASINGRLSCEGTIVNSDGPLILDLTFANVGVIRLDPTLASKNRDDGSAGPEGQVRFDGLTYSGLPEPDDVDTWLRWLRGRHYSPQPYEQLATAYRRAGLDRRVRTILLAKQRERRKGLRLLAKTWGVIQDITVGYGYVPIRAAAWIIGLWVLGWWYFSTHEPSPFRRGNPEPTYDALAYTLDLLLPVVNLGQRGIWNSTGTAQVVAYLLMASGWVLTTTVIAGITNVLKRQ